MRSVFKDKKMNWFWLKLFKTDIPNDFFIAVWISKKVQQTYIKLGQIQQLDANCIDHYILLYYMIKRTLKVW
jgi:hypothetical protein